MSPPRDRSVDRPAPGRRDPGPRRPRLRPPGLRPPSLAHLEARLAAATAAARAALGYLTFWTAVCLPVLLVALLVTGIETVAQARAFLVVTAVECVALAAGRIHLSE